MDGRLGAVGVDERDGPLLLLVGGVLPRRQHHTELETPGPPLTWCSPATSGLEVMTASVVWSARKPVTEASLHICSAGPKV